MFVTTMVLRSHRSANTPATEPSRKLGSRANTIAPAASADPVAA